MHSIKASLTPFIICLFLTTSGSFVESRNASILVFGRSGAGVSSTVRMLLGYLYPTDPTEITPLTLLPTKSVITEYLVPIPEDSSSFLKIVDVDGVTDNRLPEDDAYVQASLETYVTHPEGLNSVTPTAVLIISSFDDTRYNSDQSTFVRMLKRIIDVERSIYPNGIPDINILLFTRLMAEVKSINRSPKKKLASFKATAIEYVDEISPNIVTLVGENKGDDYGLTLNENGTYRLPNREIYPTNVLNAIANLARNNGENEGAIIIENFAQLRFNANEDSWRTLVSRVPFIIAPDSREVDFYTRGIVRSGKGDIEDNEVNSALQLTYEGLSDSYMKTRTANIVPTLQAFLQSSNITKFSDLPSTGLNKVKFFHSLPVDIEQDVVNILEKALNLTMPPFIQALTVGHGYDLLKDEILPATSVPFSPVAINSWKFSPMGYLIPSFLSCTKLQHTKIQAYKHFADTLSQSVQQRQTNLDYPNKEAFNASNFNGQVRLGFNIQPSEDGIPTLSSVKEIQIYKMELNDNFEFSKEFKESVGLLTPFDSSRRDSEKEWKGFFEKWGTHVVSSGFLGGYIQGTLISDDIVRAYEEENQVIRILERLVNFTQMDGQEGLRFYGAFGGDKDTRLANVHELSEGERNQVMKKWESSLPYESVVLNYELELIPISVLIGRVNVGFGSAARTALDLFLQGKLTYKRAFSARPVTKGSIRSSTVRFTTPATTVPVITTPKISSQTVAPLPSAPTPSNRKNMLDTNNQTAPDTAIYENNNKDPVILEGFKLVPEQNPRFRVNASFLNGSEFQRKNDQKVYEEPTKLHDERLEELLRVCLDTQKILERSLNRLGENEQRYHKIIVEKEKKIADLETQLTESRKQVEMIKNPSKEIKQERRKAKEIANRKEWMKTFGEWVKKMSGSYLFRKCDLVYRDSKVIHQQCTLKTVDYSPEAIK